MTYGVGFKRRPTAARVELNDDFVSASGGTALGSTARWRINAAGTIQTKAGTAAYVTEYNWLLIGANTEFQVQLTQLSGPGTLSGVSASWLDTTADREVTLGTTMGSVTGAILQVKIRDKVTLAELANCQIDFEAEWF